MSKIMKTTKTTMNNMRTSEFKQESIDTAVERIYAGKETLSDLLAVKDKSIDFSKCLRKIRTVQRIYSGGSAVGACTIVAGNMYTVELTEDNMHVYKDALKMLKERKEHKAYGESIWVEGYNKFSEFCFETGHYYVYYVVTNEEIRALESKITNMDYNSVTLEDLQTLQNDLPPFVRAWQESSIDVSKDKDKVFDKNYDAFFKKIDVTSTFLKQHMEGIALNLNAVKDLHRAGKRTFNFNISLPLTDNVLPDMLGKANMAFVEATKEFFNEQMAPLYSLSDRRYYQQFANDCEQHPELALFIQQVYNMCKQSFNDETGLTKEDYALLRNAIYTKAAEYGLEDMTEVVRIAISVAMRYVQLKDKEIVFGVANVDNLKLFLVQKLFEQEFEVLRTNQPIVNKLTLVYVEKGVEILEGETVEFVNGVSTNDEVEVEELFTGVAFNKGGELVYDVDVYAYEEVKSVVTVATFKEETTVAELETDKGEFAAKYFDNYDVITVAGKNANILANGKMLVAKTVASPALKGNHMINRVISFETTENKARVFFMVLA